MGFFKILLGFFKKSPVFGGVGALDDDRSQEAKDKDFHFKEIVASANPVSWVEKSQEQWRKFPIFNQNGSGSCVAFTIAKLLGILYWLKNQSYVHFSAISVYQRRKNKPSAGMIGVDALDIARQGVTLEVLVPSQDMNDAQMDGTVIEKYKQDVGNIFKIGNYVQLPIGDIETVASVIQTTNKAVMVWYRFDFDEWGDVPKVLKENPPYHHSVTATDFFLYEGKKAILIEDSWGLKHAFGGRRIITEDFHKARNTFAAYPINFKFEEGDAVKPVHRFEVDLKLGDNNADVAKLQDILKFEGLFPNNVESTAFYGAITAQGVMAFQKKHNVAPIDEIEFLGGKRVGIKTRGKLNILYSN